MRSTSPHRVHRRARIAATLVASAAMVAVGLQANVATAADSREADSRLDRGALPAKMTVEQRASLIKRAEKGRAETADALGLGKKVELRVKDVVKNRDGSTHTRYERTYAGLPVLGGQIIVHRTPQGTIEGVDKGVEAKVKVPSTEAPNEHQPATPQARNSEAPRKVVWAAHGEPTLAWETVVGGKQSDGTPSELHVITDAHTGEKLYQYQAVHKGTGNSMYVGTVDIVTSGYAGSYTMNDTQRGGHKTYNLDNGGQVFTDEDNVWGNHRATHPQTAAVDAHYGAALTWDYYLEVHSRRGIRGDGVAASSRVHYGNAYSNAFWRDSCFCMTYGDGRNNQHPLTSIDVAAHEMTHGVTSATAGLIYRGESGGLNEATSDIFAAAVEFHANNPDDVGDYRVGEKIDIFGNGEPLRYMAKPSKDGDSLDHWTPSAGREDVHHSSGIANHFFYLLAEGSGQKVINGVTYDSPTYDNQPVTGIGIAAAEKIWFKALAEHMLPNETFAQARTHTLRAAGELFGQGSPQQLAVGHAWAAVNVGERPEDPQDPGDNPPGEGEFENSDVLDIPDGGPAVTSPITVTGIGGDAPSDLEVTVDISHSYRGDLVIDLLAPDGTAYRLKDSGWDSGDDVRKTYTVDVSSETADGTWKLRVEDTWASDTGQLNSWKLSF